MQLAVNYSGILWLFGSILLPALPKRLCQSSTISTLKVTGRPPSSVLSRAERYLQRANILSALPVSLRGTMPCCPSLLDAGVSVLVALLAVQINNGQRQLNSMASDSTTVCRALKQHVFISAVQSCMKRTVYSEQGALTAVTDTTSQGAAAKPHSLSGSRRRYY
jgi:hypothetical protein